MKERFILILILYIFAIYTEPKISTKTVKFVHPLSALEGSDVPEVYEIFNTSTFLPTHFVFRLSVSNFICHCVAQLPTVV